MTEKEIREVLEELGYKPVHKERFHIVNGKHLDLGYLMYIGQKHPFILVDPDARNTTVTLGFKDIPFKTLDELRRLLI